MGILFSIKRKIMLAKLKKKNSEHPFNLETYETYTLPSNASRDDVNSYYFSAHNLDGESLVIRKNFRGEGIREIWVIYHTKEATYANKISRFENEDTGLSISLIEVGRLWAFAYKGKLNKVHINENKLGTLLDEEVEVEINGTFKSESKMFDYASHIDHDLLASAIAKEKWHKDFIRAVNETNVARVEQQGQIEATIKLNDKDIIFKSNAMREHSFGYSDWNRMNRHFLLITLIRKGEALNLSRIAYPQVDKLITGYFEKDDRIQQISKNTNGARVPNVGYIPEVFFYSVELQNGVHFNVKANVEVIIPYTIHNGEYIIYEGIGTFEINRRKGRGVMEFGFNIDENKWRKIEY